MAAAKDEDSEQKANGSGPFSEGEAVLAYHGPRIYEAKVLKAELRGTDWAYLIHYLGWSKKWDEWMGGDRLLKKTEENIARQQSLFKEEKDKKAAKKRKERAAAAAAAGAAHDKDTKGAVKADEGPKSPGGKPKKRKAEKDGEGKSGEEKPQLIKIPLSTQIRRQLVDDYSCIVKEGKLLKLPRAPNVAQILDAWLASRGSVDSSANDATAEVASGLKAYFDRALPVMLLYKQERAQFEETIPEGSKTSPSEVYGPEHVLRLFTKMPELLAYVTMEDEAMSHLLQKLNDFLKFIQKNSASYFSPSFYEAPSSQP